MRAYRICTIFYTIYQITICSMYLFKFQRTKSHRKRQQKLSKFVQSSSGCSQSPIAYQLLRADSAASVNRLLIMNVYNINYMYKCICMCAVCMYERTRRTITYKTIGRVGKLLVKKLFVYVDWRLKFAFWNGIFPN